MKIAVVTGASRGLGRSMAEHLSRAGWGIVGTYNSSEDEADKVAASVRDAGGRIVFLRFDASHPDSIPSFVEQLRESLASEFDRSDVDALVNNAGIGLTKPYVDTSEEDFDRLFAIQVKSPFFLTQRLLPVIADGGRILNISSGLARFTLAGNAAYAATKGAIEVLTRYQALELGDRRIRVNVVAPGAIATDFNGGGVRDDEQYNKAVSDMIALGRPGEADDIGAAVAAVLSEDFAWANGARIEISGGQRL